MVFEPKSKKEIGENTRQILVLVDEDDESYWPGDGNRSRFPQMLVVAATIYYE